MIVVFLIRPGPLGILILKIARNAAILVHSSSKIQVRPCLQLFSILWTQRESREQHHLYRPENFPRSISRNQLQQFLRNPSENNPLPQNFVHAMLSEWRVRGSIVDSWEHHDTNGTSTCIASYYLQYHSNCNNYASNY